MTALLMLPLADSWWQSTESKEMLATLSTAIQQIPPSAPVLVRHRAFVARPSNTVVVCPSQVLLTMSVAKRCDVPPVIERALLSPRLDFVRCALCTSCLHGFVLFVSVLKYNSAPANKMPFLRAWSYALNPPSHAERVVFFEAVVRSLACLSAPKQFSSLCLYTFPQADAMREVLRRLSAPPAEVRMPSDFQQPSNQVILSACATRNNCFRLWRWHLLRLRVHRAWRNRSAQPSR